MESSRARTALALPAFRESFSWTAVWAALALVAINVIVYAPVRDFGFVDYDDGLYVRDNPNVAHGLTWRGARWAMTSGYATNWHPLTWLSHMLDVQAFGMNPGAHHLTNLVLHIAATVLLFAVFNWMTASIGKSAFIAAVFAVHPLHVESVAWVAERKDVLSTVLLMLALCAYVGYVRRPRRGRYLVVMLLYALGLMAKPMLVTLPFVLLLLDVWPLGRIPLSERRATIRPLLIEKVPLLSLAIASSVITFAVQRHGGAMSGLDVYPLPLRLANAVVSYVAYIEKTVWPSGLAVLYPYPRSIAVWLVAVSLALLLAVTVLVIRSAPRRPYLFVGWLWYVITLVPVIGLIQVGIQSMADRYTYVPMVGLLVMAAWGVPENLGAAPMRRVALGAAAGFLIVACMLAARRQLAYWKDFLAPWQRAAAVTQGNYLAEYNLGSAMADSGKTDDALVHYSRAVQFNPDYAPARNNLGVSLGNKGRLDDALEQFNEAVRLRPNEPDYQYNAAVMLARKGRNAEAIARLQAALHVNPTHANARRLLDVLTSQQK